MKNYTGEKERFFNFWRTNCFMLSAIFSCDKQKEDDLADLKKQNTYTYIYSYIKADTEGKGMNVLIREHIP